MTAPAPVDYPLLRREGSRLVEAHQYFADEARAWLSLGEPEELAQRAAALDTAVRDLIHIVVIDLGADENAQEIFETLNARGAELTAADLIKNLVFQRLLEDAADVEGLYDAHWRQFETAFWEERVTVGRLQYQRSSVFLNHWLVARTGEEIVARDVFSRFRSYVDQEADAPMASLVAQIDAAAHVYRQFVESAFPAGHEAAEELNVFSYRTGVLESEVIKPLMLHLLDPDLALIPTDQLTKGLAAIESWMVRRMLVRATTRAYNKVIAELITQLKKSTRELAGTAIETYFAGQHVATSYWPDDAELRGELRTLAAYRRLRRPRLRMVLEAIEDHLRGFGNDRSGLVGEHVPRAKYTIEHILPQTWTPSNWPLPQGTSELDRQRLVDTIGNLTLVTSKLNSKVSNGSWLGNPGKKRGMEEHDVLFLNKRLLQTAGDTWNEAQIVQRCDTLAGLIAQIWPIPEGHHSEFGHDKALPHYEVRLADLVASGLLASGTHLTPRKKEHAHKQVAVLTDGRLDVDGTIYDSPSGAAHALTGRPTNGWWFFFVDPASKKTLRGVRSDYLDSLAEEAEDEDDEEEVMA